MSTLERELRLLRAFAVVTYPFACVPFLYLWFGRYGVDQAGFGEVIAVYYLAMFAAEIPTGILADRIGPKPMLVIGPLLLSLGFALLLALPSYGGFLAGEALLGCGHAVLSGPPAVMLYETLKQHGQEHRYLAEEARVNARRLYGTGASFLLGGLLARCGNATGDAFAPTIVATAVLTALAGLIATRLTARPGRPFGRDFVRRATTDLRRPAVLWLLGYWVVLFALLRYPFHNYQPYLAATATIEPLLGDALFVGLLFAALNLVAAPLSAQVPRLVQRYGRVALFFAMPMALAGSYLVMGYERHAADLGESTRALAWLGVAMFFVQQVPFGLHTALIQEFVNHRIGSTARTTVLSVLSLGARLVYAGCNVALFRSQQRNGMAITLFAAGGIGLLAALLILWLRPRGTLRGEGVIDRELV
ncbi:MAG: MFS transporter [Planctomycetes bacterium]|nr:MFS transporter [Planctomycetota bacterium]